MSTPLETQNPSERTRLLKAPEGWWGHHNVTQDGATDTPSTHRDRLLSVTTVGDRLSYNEYTTIDWQHDLVKDSYRLRLVNSIVGIRGRVLARLDACSGWIVVAIMGTLTACVAFLVDICEATVSDWKLGYCTTNPFLSMDSCCNGKTPLVGIAAAPGQGECQDWHAWTSNWWGTFGIYSGFALLFGIISATATTFTKRALPAASPGQGDKVLEGKPAPKAFSMAAGSGIPEIKTFLGGFEIPHFFDFRVLFVKAFGAVFAVATGMCLGKEGPFVHISGCVGYLVAKRVPKYRDNGRKMREILSAAVAAGLSVAFGAPIGGVLFSYEEISTYFPRKTLWRAFLCSLCAAIVLKALNPNGTGKLVLFETDYGTQYLPEHYCIFVILGIAGGLWGGAFCRLNFKWSRWFRSYSLIKNNPVFEVFIVVLATVLLQYPNPLTRDPGDKIISNLLVNCNTNSSDSSQSYVCRSESSKDGRQDYILWLTFGCIVKLVLTTITFGAKVPSGIIIPALDAGALFGRLVGQSISTVSPGIFAMVGAAAFLAGVSRMTISLCVIMFELTGELEYVIPHMVAILVAKWVADALSAESVYDLAQNVLGHPFLDADAAILRVQRCDPPHLVRRLIPPLQTMKDITVDVPPSNSVSRSLLQNKLDRLRARGLLDAGVVLVQNDMLQGYLGEAELAHGLDVLGTMFSESCRVRLLGELPPQREMPRQETLSHGRGFGDHDDDQLREEDDMERAMRLWRGTGDHDELDLSSFVDRTPPSICEAAPMEYAIEAFGKLGLRHLMITEERTGKLVGVCLKKRIVSYLETL